MVGPVLLAGRSSSRETVSSLEFALLDKLRRLERSKRATPFRAVCLLPHPQRHINGRSTSAT